MRVSSLIAVAAFAALVMVSAVAAADGADLEKCFPAGWKENDRQGEPIVTCENFATEKSPRQQAAEDKGETEVYPGFDWSTTSKYRHEYLRCACQQCGGTVEPAIGPNREGCNLGEKGGNGDAAEAAKIAACAAEDHRPACTPAELTRGQTDSPSCKEMEKVTSCAVMKDQELFQGHWNTKSKWRADYLKCVCKACSGSYVKMEGVSRGSCDFDAADPVKPAEEAADPVKPAEEAADPVKPAGAADPVKPAAEAADPVKPAEAMKRKMEPVVPEEVVEKVNCDEMKNAVAALEQELEDARAKQDQAAAADKANLEAAAALKAKNDELEAATTTADETASAAKAKAEAEATTTAAAEQSVTTKTEAAAKAAEAKLALEAAQAALKEAQAAVAKAEADQVSMDTAAKEAEANAAAKQSEQEQAKKDREAAEAAATAAASAKAALAQEVADLKAQNDKTQLLAEESNGAADATAIKTLEDAVASRKEELIAKGCGDEADKKEAEEAVSEDGGDGKEKEEEAAVKEGGGDGEVKPLTSKECKHINAANEACKETQCDCAVPLECEQWSFQFCDAVNCLLDQGSRIGGATKCARKSNMLLSLNEFSMRGRARVTPTEDLAAAPLH